MARAPRKLTPGLRSIIEHSDLAEVVAGLTAAIAVPSARHQLHQGLESWSGPPTVSLHLGGLGATSVEIGSQYCAA
jgi:hypothetical protein